MNKSNQKYFSNYRLKGCSFLMPKRNQKAVGENPDTPETAPKEDFTKVNRIYSSRRNLSYSFATRFTKWALVKIYQ